jgi:hypothetical protein
LRWSTQLGVPTLESHPHLCLRTSSHSQFTPPNHFQGALLWYLSITNLPVLLTHPTTTVALRLWLFMLPQVLPIEPVPEGQGRTKAQTPSFPFFNFSRFWPCADEGMHPRPPQGQGTCFGSSTPGLFRHRHSLRRMARACVCSPVAALLQQGLAQGPTELVSKTLPQLHLIRAGKQTLQTEVFSRCTNRCL